MERAGKKVLVPLLVVLAAAGLLLMGATDRREQAEPGKMEVHEGAVASAPRGGVPSRVAAAADKIHWNGTAWALKNSPALVQASREPMDLDVAFDEDPARWLETEVWMYDSGAERERIFECHQRARDLSEPCEIRFTMVVERTAPDVAVVQYVEPHFDAGDGDPICSDLAECLAGVRLRSQVPLPSDAPALVALERRERLHPTANLEHEEKLARFEAALRGVRSSLKALEQDPQPHDPRWIREQQVLTNSAAHLQWLLDKLREGP